MGRWFSTALLVIALAIGAVLVIPSFIDWTVFRPQIERQASRLAGRPVTIAGDIGIRLLPTPDLLLGDLTIGDPAASNEPLLAAKRIEASADWLSLLFGEIRFVRLVLIEPVVRVTTRADGTTNWGAASPQAAAPPAGAAVPIAPIATAPPAMSRIPLSAVSLRAVRIERGTLILVDERVVSEDTFEAVDAALTVVKASGPWTGEGSFALAGETMGVRFAADLIQPKLASPARLEVLFPAGNGSLVLEGEAQGLAEAVAELDTRGVLFSGDLTLAAGRAAPVAKGLIALAAVGTPSAQRQSQAHWNRFRSLPTGIVGKARLTRDAFAVEGDAALGKTKGKVAASRSRDGKRLSVSAHADIAYLDEIVDVTGGGTARIGVLSALRGPILMLSSCACTGDVALTARKMMLADGALTDGVIDVALAEGGARLRAASAVLPGVSSLKIEGDMPRGQDRGNLFEGRLIFTSGEPRILLAWLGVPPERLAPALKSVALDGPLYLIDRTRTEGGLKDTTGAAYVAPLLKDASLSLGEDAFKLTAGLDERPPRAITFRLEGAHLDADAYAIGGLVWPRRALDASAWRETLWGRAAASADVDLGLDLAEVVIGGRTIKGLKLEAARKADTPGTLDLSIADFAGYQVALDAERAAAPAEVAPAMRMALAVKGTGAGAGSSLTLPFAGQPIPGGIDLDLRLEQGAEAAALTLVGRLGPMALSGEGAGPSSSALLPDLERLTISGRMKEGTAVISGALRSIDRDPEFSGNLTIDAVDFVRYLKSLGYVYNPRRQDLGALSVVSSLDVSGERTDFNAFAVSVGQQTAEGSLLIDTTGPKPRFTAEVRGGEISLDGFLQTPEGRGTWSTERIDSDLLTRADGTLALTAGAVGIGPYKLKDLRANLVLENGRLASEDIASTLFDGRLALKASASATQAGVLTVFDGTLENADIGALARRLVPSSDIEARGRVQFSGDAEGRSMFGLVSSLEGNGALSLGAGSLSAFDILKWQEGLKVVQTPESFLRLAKDALSGGVTSFTSGAIAARASKGTLQIESGEIKTGAGALPLKGNLKIPVRTMSLRIDLPLAALSDLPAAAVVFTGPLDKPVRAYDLRALQSAMLKRFEAAGAGRIREEDLPPDLRELLKEVPKVEP